MKLFSIIPCMIFLVCGTLGALKAIESTHHPVPNHIEIDIQLPEKNSHDQRRIQLAIYLIKNLLIANRKKRKMYDKLPALFHALFAYVRANARHWLIIAESVIATLFCILTF
jgi:hypothetical protein